MSDTQNCILLPTVLSRIPTKSYRVAVLGTCVAESFARAAVYEHMSVDHYLMQSHPGQSVPEVNWSAYDAIMVQITLRQMLWGLTDSGEDVFHVRPMPEYDRDLAAGVNALQAVVDRVVMHVNGAAPVFFLSFLEPSRTYQGILLNNRKSSFYHYVRSLNDRLAEIVASHDLSYYIEFNDIMAYYGDAVRSDGYFNHYSHAGIADNLESHVLYESLLKRLSMGLDVLSAASPVKIIITDLDNTLWKGVVAEFDEIVPHLHYEGWPLGYVEALLEFKRRGGLLAICSKNDEAPTIDRFKNIWRGRITPQDFCSVKINWNPKSENIAQILEEANLLPSNALFIDDNPREIEEVKRIFPEMRFLTGKQEKWRSIILYSAETQVARISEESSNRTELVRAKVERDSASNKMDRHAYLLSLHINVKFDNIDSSSHPKFERCFELINKTNQFNTNGRRWALGELNDFLISGGRLISLSSTDSFGDNGLVAVSIWRGGELLQTVMSCRVFGFSLEVALLHQVWEASQPVRGQAPLTATYMDTGKNRTCASYFKDTGFRLVDEPSGRWELLQSPEWPRWIERPA